MPVPSTKLDVDQVASWPSGIAFSSSTSVFPCQYPQPHPSNPQLSGLFTSSRRKCDGGASNGATAEAISGSFLIVKFTMSPVYPTSSLLDKASEQRCFESRPAELLPPPDHRPSRFLGKLYHFSVHRISHAQVRQLCQCSQEGLKVSTDK
jgi:hypothetical protein